MSFFDAHELENLEHNPYCIHGPTILFENTNQNKRFYSCSATRNHKKCNFYQDSREFDEDELQKWMKIYKRCQIKPKTSKRLRLRLKSLNFKDRVYCKTCDRFLINQNQQEICKDKKHDCVENIKKSALREPTKYILNPLVDDDSNAQFYFNDRTLEYFLSIIEQAKFDSVLCVGTPTIFELVRKNSKIKSLLLDLDDRFMQFYPKKLFLKYNMFNNHFFHGKKSFLNFVRNSNKLLIIVDPPYGGLVKLIANTINELLRDCGEKDVSIILIYPYFMETWVHKWLPQLKMTDFKVSYRNQRNFAENSNNKGSSARIFTNIEIINQIEIPKMEEYKDYYYCELCNKYTYAQNKHCLKCMKCTSKDGGHYKHCDPCARCVKNSYIHCNSCALCHLKGGCFKKNEKLLKCFKCNSFEHKSKDCDFDFKNNKIND